MKRTLFYLLILVCVGLAGAVGLLLFRGKPEPVYLGRPAHQWVRDLASGDYQTRDKAAAAIRAIGPDSASYLIAALRKRETLFSRIRHALARRVTFIQDDSLDLPLLHQEAAEQLGDLGQTHPEIVLPALIQALAQADQNVILEVQRALRRLSPQSLPALISALHHRREKVRANAAQILGDLEPLSPTAIPGLIAALEDRSVLVRVKAASALGRVREHHEDVLPALTLALKDPEASVRSSAADALGRIGSPAKTALASISNCLRDPSPRVRLAAARGCWQIDSQIPDVLPVLIASLQSPEVSWEAALVLREMGPGASAAVPALIESLKRERVPRPLRSPPSSALALGRMGPSAVRPLIAALRHRDARVRTSAAIALGLVGPDAAAAYSELFALLTDEDEEVRAASTLSLAAIGPERQEVVPALEALCRDDDIFISSLARGFLRKIAPATAAALGPE